MPSFQLLDTVGPTLDFNVISGEIAARQQRLTVRTAATTMALGIKDGFVMFGLHQIEKKNDFFLAVISYC